ncbi:hypothetical protein M758_3G030800 [Ceratodon purpureus]|uniref:40S ribosomal protein S25 n=1 Tax=Ceratodon purpureus TaxID=3225 RepID=A0A8T0IGN6_CERPU|nr:hypothetical protein KC19_3G032000 [Ceratodon purpureus]KAG0621570.1 hypothetical protein M758_3G030800 [Ceratodon purpureus]
MAPKKKETPAAKPAKSTGGGKQKKKKWSKGKQKEKVNNMVLFDQGTYDKLLAEVPKFKLVTPSVLSDRLRVSNSPSYNEHEFWLDTLCSGVVGLFRSAFWETAWKIMR